LNLTSINDVAPVGGAALTLRGAIVIVGKNESGSFSISTTHADDYSLFVDNGVVSEDFIIAAATAWADYVFEDDYKLPSLGEVERYIAQNKHLPGVPSFEEVKKDGYAIHKMNTLYLQKIEELTLYAIEQDKKIKKLEGALSKVGKLMEEVEMLKERVGEK
jgi:hypothetical protein